MHRGNNGVWPVLRRRRRPDRHPASNPALVLTAAKVVMETCTFTPWGEFLPATISPGETLVLTQTGAEPRRRVSGAPSRDARPNTLTLPRRG